MTATRKPTAKSPANFIDLTTHIPTIIAICANRLSRSASRFYRERYGIGIVEWRALIFIGRQPKTSANEICRGTDLDKGAVSRSLRVLQRGGLIQIAAHGSDSRRRTITLTKKGRALHDRMVPAAQQRHRRLVAGISGAEMDALMRTIRRIEAHVPQPARATRIRRPKA
jgi:DNA-binding MarR family transcriptional regulator